MIVCRSRSLGLERKIRYHHQIAVYPLMQIIRIYKLKKATILRKDASDGEYRTCSFDNCLQRSRLPVVTCLSILNGPLPKTIPTKLENRNYEALRSLPLSNVS